MDPAPKIVRRTNINVGVLEFEEIDISQAPTVSLRSCGASGDTLRPIMHGGLPPEARQGAGWRRRSPPSHIVIASIFQIFHFPSTLASTPRARISGGRASPHSPPPPPLWHPILRRHRIAAVSRRAPRRDVDWQLRLLLAEPACAPREQRARQGMRSVPAFSPPGRRMISLSSPLVFKLGGYLSHVRRSAY
jgi:hypothetical protein